MKRILIFLLAFLMVFCLFGCKKDVSGISESEFDTLLKKQPLVIVETQLLAQTEIIGNKHICPDLLTAIFQNRTDKVITDVQIAFVAWDKDGNPIKIKSPEDNTSYDIKSVQYKNITLGSGRYYGKNIGLKLEANHKISKFKAFVVSFETEDGNRYENPYYDEFVSAFVSKTRDEKLLIDVKEVKNRKFKVLSGDELKKTELTLENLEKNIQKQPIQIISSECVVNGENKKLTPDTLKAVLQNNSKVNVKKIIVTFLGYDENGKPVKISDALDEYSAGNFAVNVEYTPESLEPNKQYGENDGYEISENCNIKYVKAIVESFTDIDGNVWENPYLIDYCMFYEGKDIEVPVIDENESSEETSVETAIQTSEVVD